MHLSQGMVHNAIKKRCATVLHILGSTNN
uniref:Uncharacterized protein n=1 Tax=Arundo donax TaxID=35708 RepID=A0A0A9GQK8_ARUDO